MDISIFSQFKPTKTAIELFAETIAEQVNNGEIDPVVAHFQCSVVENYIKSVREKIADAVVDGLMKFPKSTAEIEGAKMSAVDVTRFDFSHLPEWAELENVIVAAKEKQKAIEEEEKKWRRGELPIKGTATSIRVQLSK
jgi:hypothetical protein